MADNRFDGKRVSSEWDVVLTAARKAGVAFHLDSGRRTMAEQWKLWRAYKAGGTLAAYPSPNAPHIRLGRIDHACDVNSLDGGETRLQHWLQARGAHPTNPVQGEAWHMEVPAPDLRKLAARFTHAAEFPVLRKGTINKRGVLKLQRYLKAVGYRSVRANGHYDLATRLAVRRFQRKHHIAPDAQTTVTGKTWDSLARVVHN